MDVFDTPGSQLAMDIESAANTAAGLGIATMACAFLGQCTCYFGYVVGLATGVGAIYLATQVQSHNPQGEARAYANVGLYTGAIGLAFNLMVLVLLAMVLAFYAVMFVMIALTSAL